VSCGVPRRCALEGRRRELRAPNVSSMVKLPSMTHACLMVFSAVPQVARWSRKDAVVSRTPNANSIGQPIQRDARLIVPSASFGGSESTPAEVGSLTKPTSRQTTRPRRTAPSTCCPAARLQKSCLWCTRGGSGGRRRSDQTQGFEAPAPVCQLVRPPGTGVVAGGCTARTLADT
jgi:hypothetical protein